MSNSDRIEVVRNLLRQEKYGVLSTLSVKHEGWPFGSATPYALTASGEPLIFVSSLAEHTRIDDEFLMIAVTIGNVRGFEITSCRRSNRTAINFT